MKMSKRITGYSKQRGTTQSHTSKHGRKLTPKQRRRVHKKSKGKIF